MKKINFDWMVFDRVDKHGIWFIGSKSKSSYVFWWNPIRVIFALIKRGLWFGLFPLTKNHIL